MGAPQADCRVEVRAHDGRPVPAGHRGEIWVAAPAIALSYWPPGARAGFVTDSAGYLWFRTGDLARRDAAGTLHLEGRLDRQVTVYGMRVELDEIETVARAHPAVSQAIAVLEHEYDADRIQLWAESDSPDLAALDIRRHLAKVLPSAAVPDRIDVVDRLGWTTRMKLTRPPGDAIRSAQPPSATRVTPDWTMERLLRFARKRAEEVLGGRLDDDKNFFDAGFDSLALFRYATVLGDALGQPVGPLTLFRYPNLRALGQHLYKLMTSAG